jgi:hypothetical protein
MAGGLEPDAVMVANEIGANAFAGTGDEERHLGRGLGVNESCSDCPCGHRRQCRKPGSRLRWFQQSAVRLANRCRCGCPSTDGEGQMVQHLPITFY